MVSRKNNGRCVNCTFIVFYKLNFYEKWYCYYFSFLY
nr:MAG TPA: hypothetical protein [Caudoviricetes sp.]